MAWVLLPTQDQLQNANDVNASGYVIKCYQAGTTTPISMAIDKDGGTTISTATANADGFWEVSGNEVKLYVDQATYPTVKTAVYENASDAAADTNPFWGPIDHIKLFADPIAAGSKLNPYSNYSAVRALDSSTFDDGDYIWVEGVPTPWQWKTGTVTDDIYYLVPADDSNRYAEQTSKNMTLEDFLVTDEATFEAALLASGVHGLELTGTASFTQTTRIDLPASFNLRSNKGDVVITADATYWSGSEFAMIYGAAVTNISDSTLEGVKVIGGLSDYNNDGTDRHGILIYGCTDTSVRRCDAETLERGIILRDGTTGGELAYNEAKNCYDQGVGYIGTSGSPVSKVDLHHNLAYTTGFTTEQKPTGIRLEEVYDSHIYINTAYRCNVGHRWENSCDNEMYGNIGYENDQAGGELYNASQRNTVYGNRFFDNNVSQKNEVSLTPDNKGNADTKLSGLNVENNSNNNVIYGNKFFQTDATTIPFNSGSTEPTVKDTISGATSGATGLVRRVEVYSGSWAGGDAGGVIHVITVTGTWNASENIDNDTTPSTNIATTNGAITVGTSIGFQQYGVGVNIRNLSAGSDADSYNLIYGNQCFNNNLNSVEDRGYGNNVFGNTDNDFYFNIRRNV